MDFTNTIHGTRRPSPNIQSPRRSYRAQFQVILQSAQDLFRNKKILLALLTLSIWILSPLLLLLSTHNGQYILFNDSDRREDLTHFASFLLVLCTAIFLTLFVIWILDRAENLNDSFRDPLRSFRTRQARRGSRRLPISLVNTDQGIELGIIERPRDEEEVGVVTEAPVTQAECVQVECVAPVGRASLGDIGDERTLRGTGGQGGLETALTPPPPYPGRSRDEEDFETLRV